MSKPSCMTAKPSPTSHCCSRRTPIPAVPRRARAARSAGVIPAGGTGRHRISSRLYVTAVLALAGLPGAALAADTAVLVEARGGQRAAAGAAADLRRCGGYCACRDGERSLRGAVTAALEFGVDERVELAVDPG